MSFSELEGRELISVADTNTQASSSGNTLEKQNAILCIARPRHCVNMVTLVQDTTSFGVVVDRVRPGPVSLSNPLLIGGGREVGTGSLLKTILVWEISQLTLFHVGKVCIRIFPV